MGWPVTELYRDVKSPWARQRNPIWRPLLGGDNSAPASRASCHALSTDALRLSHRVRGDFRFRTPPPPTPTYVQRLLCIYKTRTRKKRFHHPAHHHHNTRFRGFNSSKLVIKIVRPVSRIEPVTPNLPDLSADHYNKVILFKTDLVGKCVFN